MNENIAFGGIKRVPGGATGSDGDLAVAVDVCNDGMSLELLENPEELFELETGEELLCIHEPEGEGKHYITQWIYTPSSSATPTGGDNDAEAPADEDENNGEAEDLEGNGDLDEVEEPSAFEEAYMQEQIERTTDNGGTAHFPTSTGGSATVSTTGIYLCYWALTDVVEEGQTVKRFRRLETIDITPYGKVTAIQPIGNTLVCNHEGGESTVDNATVEYPAEIRYWLWKPQENVYVGLGSKPPMLNITFGLKSEFKFYPETESTFGEGPLASAEPKKYGGVTMSNTAYLDTVPLFWDEDKDKSLVPPYYIAKDEENRKTFTTRNMGTFSEDDPMLDHFQTTYSIEGASSPDGLTDVAGIKINWTRSTLAAYNKFIADHTKDNKFVFPFYIRYGYELYDGSYIMHSNPVLMIPNSKGPIFALDGAFGLLADAHDLNETYEKVTLQFKGRVYGFASTLMHEIEALSSAEQERLLNWKDLIRGIAIFVTPPIYNYDQGGQVLGWHSMDEEDPVNNGKDPWASLYTVGETILPTLNDTEHQDSGIVYLKDGFQYLTEKIFQKADINYQHPGYCMTVPQKEEKDVVDLHENAGQFFRLADIEFDKLINEDGTAGYVVDGVQRSELEFRARLLQTIANQDVMQDDSSSRDKMTANVMYGYNRRLNLAQISREMSSPLPVRVQWGDDKSEDTGDWQVIIYAKNGGKIAQLKTTDYQVNCVESPLYIFYPDTSAYEAVIVHDQDVYRVRLKEHKMLNGAFWLGDFMNDAEDLANYSISSADIDVTSGEQNKIVDESNKVYTSDTDNPFVFPLSNRNIAGGGEVRALCSAVEAMSQGQFGQHPMYCFTSEGVWAMSVNDTGGWATIQPVARDVISAGTKPLSLDSAVVFMTNRGLLLLGGSETKVLSDDVRAMMSGEWSKIGNLATTTATSSLLSAVYDNTNGWVNFPDTAKLMYDARNGRIYVSDGGMSWVYNLKSGLWTQATTSSAVQITSYPECETQMGGKVVKVSVDRTDKNNLKPYGLVVTQPFKFGAGGSLRRIHEMVVRGEFRPYGSAVKTALWGTRDWLNHALVASSTRNRLTRWGGSPYFAHSLGLFVTREGSGEWPLRIAGADFTIDGEHDNKLR